MKKIIRVFKVLLRLFIVIMPWKIKRFLLQSFYGYKLDSQAYIGFSYIYPDHLYMGPGAEIGHLNVAIKLNLISMDKNTIISQRNWITGYPLGDKAEFQEIKNRKPQLIMEEGAAISKQHHIDCTDEIYIGRYSSIGGYHTQLLTHSTSLVYNKQMCAPIKIGHNCFVGTRSILLSGTNLPDCSVLGAGAVLQKKYTETYCLYGGVPAKFVKKLDNSYTFLIRNYRSGQKIK